MQKMKQIKSSQVLSSKNAKSLTKFWQIHILNYDEKFFIQQCYWQLKQNGEESKLQCSVPTEVLGKNLGRSNETTPYNQAELQFDAKLSSYYDKGYHLASEEPKTSLLPMLAKTFNSKISVSEGVYTQPKIDGTRMIYNRGKAYSRKSKEYLTEVTKHIINELGYYDDNIYLDGELVLPVGYCFQETISAIKKYDPEVSPLLQFIIYDYYNSNEPTLNYAERLYSLGVVFEKQTSSCVQLIETKKASSITQIQAHFNEYVKNGFEGLMVRLPLSVYSPNIRSNSLLKLKEFDDDEFEIIGVEPGEGSYKNCGILICKEKKYNNYFRVNMKTTIAEKEKLLLNSEALIGKFVTVKYFGLSEEPLCKPRFPIGLVIRDYE